MLELRCPAHPLYRGLRKPKVDCADCHELYGLRRRVNEADVGEIVFHRNEAGTTFVGNVQNNGEIVDA